MNETASVSNDLYQAGNREVITDQYVPKNISSEPKKFAFKIFVRLNAKKIKFKDVSFQHCVFDSCYFNHCSFDTCDFTGCKFIGSNFHQSAFRGCKFEYATFERCQLDDDILVSEAPWAENLRMRFARSLRMNYQQIGDAKAVNKAISLELDATARYLYKSWRSRETYYQEKYRGFQAVVQFFKWLEFCSLDFVWGNGESILKLLRTMLVCVLAIAIYDTSQEGAQCIDNYMNSLLNAPAVFLGVLSPKNYPVGALTAITGMRYIAIALLTTMLVKRFGRR